MVALGCNTKREVGDCKEDRAEAKAKGGPRLPAAAELASQASPPPMKVESTFKPMGEVVGVDRSGRRRAPRALPAQASAAGSREAEAAF